MFNVSGFKRVAVHSRFLCVVIGITSIFGVQAGENIKIEMVKIPGGNFVMGCQDGRDKDCSDNEKPSHRVNITAFEMGKTEVTLGQFKQFIAAKGRGDLVDNNFMKFNSSGDAAPVVSVSWHDSQDFISWLNETAGGNYRLPSEAEWEYACRAGGNDVYCGSNNLNAVGWYEGNNGVLQQRNVGKKQANVFGLYDMSGNVWEWVQDSWHDNYDGAPNNGIAWGGVNGKVLRGGSWSLNPKFARAAYRGISFLAIRDEYQGFRLARTLP